MTLHPDDTIVAQSSAPGSGARAVVRMSGPNCQTIVHRLFSPSVTILARHVTPGQIRLSEVPAPLPADVYVFPGPHSYTGQDVVEIHTIGSPPLVERLLADILAAGARSARPGEFTLRAFLAGKMDLPRAEAVHAVIEAGTDADLKPALVQLAGGVSQPLNLLRDDLLNLLADVEAGLDFVDEDIEFVDRTQLLLRIAAGLAHLANLRRQMQSRVVSGRPVRIALVGLPNAGKSSLFNALCGASRAIVSPVAGTTRDYLTATLEWDGITIELIDTAGREQAQDEIMTQAQRLAHEQSQQADILLHCVPAGEPVSADLSSPEHSLLVRTKCDLESPAEHYALPHVVHTSVITPGGLQELQERLQGMVQTLTRPALAPSQSRCFHHVEAATEALRRAHAHVREDDPQELLALALREALDQIGEMAGAVYTNDLLDRIFSRFCIGK